MKRWILVILIACTVPVFSHSQNNYKEVTLPELMRLKQGGKDMVILDVRTNGEFYDTASRGKQYNIGHLKDAIHVELNSLLDDSAAVHQLDQYKNKDIYVICSHSYRSRVASNILLRNGFTSVNNVQGGMTEWFRRYDELANFRDFYEKNDAITGISPAQLTRMLRDGDTKRPLLIGVRSIPKFFYDSLNVELQKYFPILRYGQVFDYADSLKILDLARKADAEQRHIILYNLVNIGAAELTEWLQKKGIGHTSFLVGGPTYFVEYLAYNGITDKADRLILGQSKVRFTTPNNFCQGMLGGQPNIQLIDLRHDSLFNKVNEGTKHNYKHIKGASNFYEKKGVEAFMLQYPDKKKEYAFISLNGIDGIKFADDLSRKGYKNLFWIIGGIWRWEWFMNNMENFACNDSLEK